MKNYLIAIGFLYVMISCQDLYEVNKPDLNVWTDQQTYKVGETVQFNIEGNLDMINFYSGEIGNDYSYYDTARIYDVVPSLSFRAAKFAGNNEDCAVLLYTTEFNENYDFNNVKNVNWIDISDRFDIPPIVGTAASFSDAGKADISDLVEDDKPIYFAWYCKTNEASQRTRFQVMDFNVNGEVLENDELTGILYSQAQLGFQWSLNDAATNQESNIPSITNSLIYWDGIFNNPDFLKEGYAVSGPVIIPEQINMGLDLPRVIKTVQNENISRFLHSFSSPGEYEVVFVGYNVNYKGSKEKVIRVKLTIVEEE